MDYRSVPTADRAGRAPAVQNRPRKAQHQPPSNAAGVLHFDSDRSTTLDSLKDLMAFSQRTSRARHEDILFAAKHARAQMPPQFREPPSSTGSHGTITTSSIHLGNNNNNHNNNYNDDHTTDSSPSSTFSAGPDAESTRASVHYQRGSHRVRQSTGRFGSNGGRRGEEKKATTDILSGIVNTSALFRTFKEWKPEDATDPSIFEDADAGTHNDLDAESTTNFGVLDNFAHYDKENGAPISSAHHKTKNGSLADAPTRRNRAVLQATVQNESDMSIVMSAAVQKPKPHKPATSQMSPLRKASAAAAAPAPAPVVKKTTAAVVGHSPLLDELSSPETSADSREDADLGIRTVAASAPALKRAGSAPVPGASTAAAARTGSNDAVTNQSFLVPSASFPLLHNLVTGTLRFTPGTYFYGTSADAQRKYQLPAGPVPEDEKEIFVDIENIREEVIRLQEHDEMLQHEIIQGEIKYKALLDRFYSVAHKSSESGFGSDLDQHFRESQEQNQLLQNRILELETALDVVHTQYEQQVQSSADLAAERDAAVTRATSAADKSKRLVADLETVRERLATSSHRPNQEAQRRIQQLEQMVAERERVIKALKDERAAASSSHREECKLYKERIARMEAEKSMLSGDHAKCNDEKYALATAKDALFQKNTALKEKVHAVRQQCKDREATVHTIVERQRTQITKLQLLLREKEKSVHQLDENFRKLRESWSVKDETLMRMTDVLGQWPGGLPQEHQGTLHAETTRHREDGNERDNDRDHDHDHDFDVDTRDFQSDHGEHASDERQEAELDESDAGSDSGQSAVDHSMDENMTSAFIIPDLEFQTENVEQDEEEEAIDEQELAHELAQVQNAVTAAAAAAKARTSKTKSAQQKSVSFQTSSTVRHTTKSSSATTLCKHSRVNCVVCCQNAGHIGDNEKVTVAVPRPILARGAGQAQEKHAQLLPDPAMDPGDALAYVMKLLDDERRHLWMQIQKTRKHGETEEALNEKRRPRRALREAEELWNAYVLKVEQLNRLDDVLEGQRSAGQDMTREEIDVTITRILEV